MYSTQNSISVSGITKMLLWPYLGTSFQTQATFLGFPQLVLTASSSHQNTLRPESFRRKNGTSFWNFLLLWILNEMNCFFSMEEKKINFWWTLSQKPHLVHFLKINYWLNCFITSEFISREIYFCNFGDSITTILSIFGSNWFWFLANLSNF